MIHYFTESSQTKFKGRQRITLPVMINSDIQRAIKLGTLSNTYNISSFKSNNDLTQLIILASDRSAWKQISEEVFLAAQAEKFRCL